MRDMTESPTPPAETSIIGTTETAAAMTSAVNRWLAGVTLPPTPLRSPEETFGNVVQTPPRILSTLNRIPASLLCAVCQYLPADDLDALFAANSTLRRFGELHDVVVWKPRCEALWRNKGIAFDVSNKNVKRSDAIDVGTPRCDVSPTVESMSPMRSPQTLPADVSCSDPRRGEGLFKWERRLRAPLRCDSSTPSSVADDESMLSCNPDLWEIPRAVSWSQALRQSIRDARRHNTLSKEELMLTTWRITFLPRRARKGIASAGPQCISFTNDRVVQWQCDGGSPAEAQNHITPSPVRYSVVQRGRFVVFEGGPPFSVSRDVPPLGKAESVVSLQQSIDAHTPSTWGWVMTNYVAMVSAPYVVTPQYVKLLQEQR